MKKNQQEEIYDKESIRDKREKDREEKNKRKEKKDKKFNRRRARQIESERAREQDYFY